MNTPQTLEQLFATNPDAAAGFRLLMNHIHGTPLDAVIPIQELSDCKTITEHDGGYLVDGKLAVDAEGQPVTDIKQLLPESWEMGPVS